ncbi:MAG TPA: hypothetical protein VGQ83_39245 [Polyangia bacterium]|jgi:CRISPR/Cas system CSM-associated protein Csm2 small subunit
MSHDGNKRGWGKTVLGWFVETDGEAAPAPGELSADELIAKYAQAEAPTPSPVTLSDAPPPGPGGAVDFDAVYRAAGLSDGELDHVRKAAELLRNLPVDTPTEIKRQIVEASLKAFGYPLDAIIEAGVQQIQALHTYITNGQGVLQNLLKESTDRLAQLEQEMQRTREIMQSATEQQSQLAYACNRKKVEIQEILQFFGQEAVAKVVKESPKLHEPPA